MPPRPRRAPHVHKFGGASLADSTAVRHAVEIIRRHRREPTVVVVSAMAGTTDALLGVAQQAGSGEARAVPALAALEAQGVRSRYVDGADLVHTDGAFGQAAPDLARTDRAVQRLLPPLLARG